MVSMKYAVWFRANLDNAKKLQPNKGVDDPDVTYHFKVACACGEISKTEVCLSLGVKTYGNKQQPAVKLKKQCKSCNNTGTITMIPGEGFPLTQNSTMTRQAPLMQFLCDGYKPIGKCWVRGLWKAERASDGMEFADLDLSKAGYNHPAEGTQEEMGISDLDFELRAVRHG